MEWRIDHCACHKEGSHSSDTVVLCSHLKYEALSSVRISFRHLQRSIGPWNVKTVGEERTGTEWIIMPGMGNGNL